MYSPSQPSVLELETQPNSNCSFDIFKEATLSSFLRTDELGFGMGDEAVFVPAAAYHHTKNREWYQQARKKKRVGKTKNSLNDLVVRILLFRRLLLDLLLQRFRDLNVSNPVAPDVVVGLQS